MIWIITVFLQKTGGKKDLRDNTFISVLSLKFLLAPNCLAFDLLLRNINITTGKKDNTSKLKGHKNLSAWNSMNHELSCLTWLFSCMLLGVLKSLNQDENWLFILQHYFCEPAVMKTCSCRPVCRQKQCSEITLTILVMTQGFAHKWSLEKNPFSNIVIQWKRFLKNRGLALFWRSNLVDIVQQFYWSTAE